MIPRKKRRMIIIISIVLVILLISIAFLIIYMNTDMFKSNKTLFEKYLSKNVENFDSMYTSLNNKTDYENSLEQNKYTVNTQINVNNTENIGTTEENTNNIINQLRIVATGQVDKANQYEYQDMSLYKDEESLLKLEYIKDANIYGIHFSDLFQQYLLVENSNLQDLFSKLGYSEEQVANIPNEISMDSLSISGLQLSNEEKETLSNRYLGVIENSLEGKTFSKQQNQTIEIDGKSVQVNAYSVTLTKEQLNNLYLSILEQLRNDDIILGKLDVLQTVLDNLNQFNINEGTETQESTETLRDKFITEIDNIINQINQSNIGQDETRIIVYENMKNTVRTAIQTPEYEINLDYLATTEEEFMQYQMLTSDNESEQIINIKKTNSNVVINLENTKGGDTGVVTLKHNKEVNGNMMDKNLSIQYEDSENRVEAIISQEIQTVNQFENEITLGEDNSINLSTLEEEQLQSLLTTVTEGVNNKFTELQNQISSDEITQVLVNAKLVQEDNTLQSNGISELEKNRYNSQFEILKGQDLDSDKVLSAFNAIDGYISNYEVISGVELRIILDRNTRNEEVITTLKNFIEENKNESYNIDFEYDEATGLVSNLLLSVNED